MGGYNGKNRHVWIGTALLLLLASGLFLYQRHNVSGEKAALSLLGFSGSIESGQIVSGNIPNTSTVVRLKRPDGTSGGGGQGALHGFYRYLNATAGTWTMEVTRTTGTAGGDYEATMILIPGATSQSGGPNGSKGRLDSIAFRNGYTQSLSYTSAGELSSVTGSYGRSLGLASSGSRKILDGCEFVLVYHS
ncbi:MAG: hypothetical protein HYS17_03070 [Micavibrio aeruginosavorus]|uniref:Uncharacterized protein n=1 Tax=Micavibrio aeruginosavorus TaxID=349221 RepID=A0A7T5R3A5_9BACT|nr:MAG: hypothetical protein HYS17_03070 [Micavibrio aeruginosavorus]